MSLWATCTSTAHGHARTHTPSSLAHSHSSHSASASMVQKTVRRNLARFERVLTRDCKLLERMVHRNRTRAQKVLVPTTAAHHCNTTHDPHYLDHQITLHFSVSSDRCHTHSCARTYSLTLVRTLSLTHRHTRAEHKHKHKHSRATASLGTREGKYRGGARSG